MSKKLLDEFAKEFDPNGSLEICDSNKKWMPFLIKRLAKSDCELRIRDVHGWPHAPPRRPFQVEILTPDDEYVSYVIGFFGTEALARKWGAKHGLTISMDLAKI